MHAVRNDEAVAELARPAALAAALARAFEGTARRRAFVGLTCGDATATAFVGDDGAGGHDVPAEPLPVGCLAKVLTATLASRMLADAGIDVATPLVDVVNVGRSRSLLACVTLRQLLEHTHGIDDSLLDVPLPRAEWIDTTELARRVSAERALAAPGTIYSYGNIGALLIAAVLERLAARPYARLLRDELLAPLGAHALAGSGAPPCPSTGSGLALTLADWLRFARYAAATLAWPAGGDEMASEPIAPLPGWNPLERGVYRGWKHHGAGWFGHQSVWPGSSALLRLNPSRGIALVLVSRDHAASVVAARIFGSTLPELFDLRAPMPLGCDALGDLRVFAGHYASAAIDAQIVPRGRVLELCVHDRARGQRSRAELSAAAARTFFARPPCIPGFPYVQAVTAGDGCFLWNGRFVLRRL
jgi:CubicO group peptidase (beta-lactamase class C family)